jgi:hypothetical protein
MGPHAPASWSAARERRCGAGNRAETAPGLCASLHHTGAPPAGGPDPLRVEGNSAAGAAHSQSPGGLRQT